jgi:AraC family transcriptional regulator
MPSTSRPNPVARALWYIDSHFAEPVTLDDVARSAGVSRYHLSRAFGYATGVPLTGYLRARRLSEAARALAAGAPDILDLALHLGYGSHEAFTRAFREQFGVTPESVRGAGSTTHLTLTEPIAMEAALLPRLDAPRFEQCPTRLFAGLSERHTDESAAAIPAQWQRFAPHLGRIPGQIGHATYGIVHNSDDAGNAEYLAGVEVRDFAALPPSFARVRVGAQRYAVFTHPGHVAEIRRTWNTIWSQWLPQSDMEAVDAPCFERYDERFDPMTGMGGFEIWVPVQVREIKPA